MMRIIDADALMKNIGKIPQLRGITYGRMKRAVEETPTIDAVPVVRCKDCKHFTEGMAIGMCKRIEDKPIIPIPFNHFCSYGERRCDNE